MEKEWQCCLCFNMVSLNLLARGDKDGMKRDVCLGCAVSENEFVQNLFQHLNPDTCLECGEVCRHSETCSQYVPNPRGDW